MAKFDNPFILHDRPVLRVVQLTDCHLRVDGLDYEGIDSRRSLSRTLAKVAEQSWDLLLITGDISQDHSPDSYRLLGQMCAEHFPNTPVARLPGNHDEWSAIDRWLSQAPFVTADHLVAGNWHFLLVDSKSDTPAGWVGQSQLDQLSKTLGSFDEHCHVAVFCHHHPLPMGAYIDKHKLENGELLLGCLGGFEQLRFLAHGHVHQQNHEIFEGQRSLIDVFATPSTSMQFAAGSQQKANDDLGPAFRWFECYPDGRFVTDVIWLDKR